MLSAWTALEVLSPPSFRKAEDLASGDRQRIARLDREILPWEEGGERSRPNQRLYYQLILGTVDMASAVGSLLELFSDSRAERPVSRGNAVLTTVMLDKDGRPVDPDPVAISSFGWGVPVALRGDLSNLAEWPQVEAKLIEGLTEQLTAYDSEENVLPLSGERIERAYQWLVNKLALDERMVNRPSIAVRTYQYFKFPDPPEAIILNSFFLPDLAKARHLVATNLATPNLLRYLQMTPPPERSNLLKDSAALRDSLAPKYFPGGAWPAASRSPLALLQQSAVNLAMRDLQADGILAVNGPPGTGKTTLLRDIVAAIVTKRAEALVMFDEPENAFENSGQRVKRGQSFISLYRLHEKVRGHEIVVASSNNKAVENVSAELPGTEAIATDSTDLRYFSAISDNVLQRSTWGVVAAVLGNGKNRAEFRQKFWWDEELGFHRYLQQASGNPQLVTDNTVDPPIQRPPRIVTDERPPGDHAGALAVWRGARDAFRKTKAAADRRIADLQKAHDLLLAIDRHVEAVGSLQIEIDQAMAPISHAREKLAQSAALKAKHQEAKNALESELRASQSARPTVIGRIFGSAATRVWETRHREISANLEDAIRAATRLTVELASADAEVAGLTANYQRKRTQLAEIEASIPRARSEFKAISANYPGVFLDNDLFVRPHRERHVVAPWLDKATARARNDVFVAAMALHRAFIGAAAKPIRHNLNALMDSFGTRSLGTTEKDQLIPHLWSTLFLVVPVISTTFASVDRMFGRIGSEELGWLLVDEAGQALPQAAVGALIRTRRAVVVGDPIQVEPVVTLPDHLTDAMCRQFGVEPTVFNAPAASVQTLADSATEYFGTFETKFGTREVGVPLLVHRRCAEPMFGLSNSIAYENLMVQAKPERQSPIRDVLGPSQWFDIEGLGDDKWCPAEGEAVIEAIRLLRNAECTPDFYAVTPFVVVQDRFRERLRASGLMEGWVDNPYNWVREHVGTIHTVQGREAQAVFFILGAPEAQQNGARSWAGAKPNLLNVAATRAKEAFYVYGNRRLWRTAGVFQALDSLMPRSAG